MSFLTKTRLIAGITSQKSIHLLNKYKMINTHNVPVSYNHSVVQCGVPISIKFLGVG